MQGHRSLPTSDDSLVRAPLAPSASDSAHEVKEGEENHRRVNGSKTCCLCATCGFVGCICCGSGALGVMALLKVSSATVFVAVEGVTAGLGGCLGSGFGFYIGRKIAQVEKHRLAIIQSSAELKIEKAKLIAENEVLRAELGLPSRTAKP